MGTPLTASRQSPNSRRSKAISDQAVVRRRTVSGGNGGTSSQYQPYKDAAWGFVNHWYPALFSHELAEDELQGVQICGIPIVLRRANGKVYALKDQCLHRGVRLSEKPMCFNKKTLSCWSS
ncbi:Rieske 2Fe-2S domain-containing protein [Paraburkholderia panacisoli]|uniref:Rieske 2Fe-2S domain-containing protein n=1 Tax=Paraburkholderia panacisoli TaxID=2603818 RepID=UPI001FE6E67F|nr:Rieske 2Fe-2S domain-containing protein [Paraburkholderia panacisoli]